MNDIDSRLSEVKTILSNYRQATIRRSKRASNHNRFRACPIYQKLLDVGIDSFTAKQMDRQAHKYGISPDLNVTQTLNALKDHKQVIPPSKGAFTYPTNKERAVPGFQDNSTNSTEPGNKGVPDKKIPISSYGDDYDSCVSSLSAQPIDGGLGVDLERAKQICATQWKGQGTVGGQSKQARVQLRQAPAWMLTSWDSSIRDKALEYESRQQESRLRSGSAVNSIPSWAAVSMSSGELAAAYEQLDSENNQSRLRNASTKDQESHARYMGAIHEPIYEAQRRRADNLRQASKERAENNTDDIPAWAILHGNA